MRGTDERAGALFSYVDLEARVRTDHPLRVIRGIANEALAALAPDSRRSIRGSADPRLRRSGSCGRCCCKPSIPCDPSGN